ncbi:RNA-directed DNA polymerase, eukaryota, reverse transcriptase zinc-binding domain protein [Tanacetum coccineum]
MFAKIIITESNTSTEEVNTSRDDSSTEAVDTRRDDDTSSDKTTSSNETTVKKVTSKATLASNVIALTCSSSKSKMLSWYLSTNDEYYTGNENSTSFVDTSSDNEFPPFKLPSKYVRASLLSTQPGNEFAIFDESSDKANVTVDFDEENDHESNNEMVGDESSLRNDFDDGIAESGQKSQLNNCDEAKEQNDKGLNDTDRNTMCKEKEGAQGINDNPSDPVSKVDDGIRKVDREDASASVKGKFHAETYAKVAFGKQDSFFRKLTAMPTEIDDEGNEFAIFDENIINEGCKKWDLTVCGYFVRHNMSVNELRYNPRKMWGWKGFKDIIDMNKGVYFIKFNNEKDLEEISQQLPIWIRMCNVPLEAWTSNGISALASRLGKPLVMDNVTAEMCKMGVGRVGHARVLVEVSANKCIPKVIDVVYRDKDNKEMCKKQVQVHLTKNGELGKKNVADIVNESDVGVKENYGFTQVRNRKTNGERFKPNHKPNQNPNNQHIRNGVFVQRGRTENQFKFQRKDRNGQDSSDKTEYANNRPTVKEKVQKENNENSNGKKNQFDVLRVMEEQETVELNDSKEQEMRWKLLVNKGNKDQEEVNDVMPDNSGIARGWNSDVVNLILIHEAKQSIFCLVEAVKGQFRSYCTIVYASNTGNERKKLWGDLNRYKHLAIGNPWFLGGDFNVTLKVAEHSAGTSVMTSDMHGFYDCINQIKVEDMCSSRLNFTWTKNLHKVKKEVLSIKRRLQVVQKIQSDIDKDPYDKVLRSEEAKILELFLEASKEEEMLLLQKSKIKWLCLGDKNNSYFTLELFHNAINNRISFIHDLGWSDSKRLGRLTVRYWGYNMAIGPDVPL